MNSNSVQFYWTPGIQHSSHLPNHCIMILAIVSIVNISASIPPPHLPLLKQEGPLKSSQNNLLNGGSNTAKLLHRPKQSYPPLTKHDEFHLKKKLQYLLITVQISPQVIISKILFVFKRFHDNVSYEYGRNNYFTCRNIYFEFFKIYILLARACHALYLANKELP
jgi:hypothetical protein